GSRTAAARVAAAIDLAQIHGAHLTGLCLAVEPPVPATVFGLMPPDLLTSQRKAVLEQAETAMAQFRFAVETAGLLGEGRIVQAPDLDAADVFIQHVRHADLVILSQTDPEEMSPLRSELTTDILMGGGRPAIVIPYIGPARTLGQRVLVAWDGGREAARAVNDSLCTLAARAFRDCAVSQPRCFGQRRPARARCRHLAAPRPPRRQSGGARTVARETSIGDVILADIADNSIDLLVMGAYGHSRLRELVLGGVTRHLLAHMTVPVLMSH
ncbi:MAG: universal stress protein, partial [Rhodospirillales bacterium]|nr:universal stress protein [Rhodospirillales bacterium]